MDFPILLLTIVGAVLLIGMVVALLWLVFSDRKDNERKE
jgi:hypothetical protein